MKNEEKIVGIIDGIYSPDIKNKIAGKWLCCITSQKNIIFFPIYIYYYYRVPLYISFWEIDFLTVRKKKKELINKSVKDVLNSQSKAIFVSQKDSGNVKIKERKLLASRVEINYDNRVLHFKLRSKKQFDIINGVLKEGKNFDQASSDSVFDYVRLLHNLLLIIIVLFLICFFGYFAFFVKAI